MDRQDKKALFEEKRPRRFIPLFLIVFALVATGAVAWSLWGPVGPAQAVQAAGGEIRIPLAAVDDGKAHFYTLRHGGTDIKFFVLQSRDGVIRAALDTCDVCYKEKKGYRQEGDFMVCNNCDQQFRADKINEIRGGCNPVPVERRVAGGQVVIVEADVVNGAGYFQK